MPTEALATPERLRRMGAAAYQTIQTEVNLEAMLAAFAKAIQLTAASSA